MTKGTAPIFTLPFAVVGLTAWLVNGWRSTIDQTAVVIIAYGTTIIILAVLWLIVLEIRFRTAQRLNADQLERRIARREAEVIPPGVLRIRPRYVPRPNKDLEAPERFWHEVMTWEP